MDDDLHSRAQRHRQFVNAVRAITEPRYTITEFKQLAREWANERQISEYSRWQISELFAWLAKREQGKGRTDGA